MGKDLTLEFWEHWCNLAQKGDDFSFKTTRDYKEPKDGNSDHEMVTEKEKDVMEKDVRMTEEDEHGDKEEEVEEEEEEEEGKAKTPRQCKTEEERIGFLRSLLPQSEHFYHSVISAVVLLEVGVYLIQQISTC